MSRVPEVAVIVAVLCLLGASAYGWGRLLDRAAYPLAKSSWAFSATLGIAFWISVGGVLNLLEIAVPASLYALGGGGVLLCAWFRVRAYRERPPGKGWRAGKRAFASWGSFFRALASSSPALVVTAGAAFGILWLVPSEAFNVQDDFQKYLVRPLRMLQAGTLAGGPFDLLGVHDLGAQGFLQGVVLVLFPLSYANAFDLVLCLFLSGLLVNEVGERLGLPWPYRLLGAIAFLVIHPQYVNLSSLYSGSMMILGLICASALFVESLSRPGAPATRWGAVPIGLFAAGLVALKTTYAPFVLLYCTTLLGLLLFGVPGYRRVLSQAAVAATAGGAALLPWVAQPANDYSTLWHRALENAGAAWEGDSDVRGPEPDIATLLSPQELFYGGSYLDYSFLLAVLCLMAVVACRTLERTRVALDPYRLSAVAATVATAATYLGMIWVAAPQQGIRYTSPVLIAVFPTMLLIGLARARTQSAPGGAAPLYSLTTFGLALLVCLGISIGLFVEATAARAALAVERRTILSFPLNDAYLGFMRRALSGRERDRVLEVQARTEKDAGLLAWISTPFHLDFERNRVLTCEAPHRVWSLASRGVAGSELTALRSELRDLGVRYVMWEYAGYGMRSEQHLRRRLASPHYRHAARGELALRQLLRVLREQVEIVYDDGRLVLMDLGT